MKVQLDMLSVMDRYEALSRCGDPLEKLNDIIKWSIFEPLLDKALEKTRKSAAGRKPFPTMMMFKILVIQALYNLSDAQMEFQLKDRLSFMRFLKVSLSESTPDEKTIWAFREQLKTANVLERLFKRFDIYLTNHGFAASLGQMVDAKIVEVPKQRNSREDNACIKQGETPESFKNNEHKARQKDQQARWTVKNHKAYFGYKNHINADAHYKLIRQYAVTPANTADIHSLDNVLLKPIEAQARVWADSAYHSDAMEKNLAQKGYQSRIIRRGTKHLPLSAEIVREDSRRAKIRKRVEHVFGFMVNTMRGGLIRGVGLTRARFNLGLRNLVYNFCRYEQLRRLGAS